MPETRGVEGLNGLYYVLAAAVALFIIIYGYFIMGKIDRYFASRCNETQNAVIPEQQASGNAVLVCGAGSLAQEVVKLLNAKGVSCDAMIEADCLNIRSGYRQMLALDENDFENLLLCYYATKRIGIPHVIASCSENQNRKIFEDNQIDYMMRSHATAEQLLGKINEG